VDREGGDFTEFVVTWPRAMFASGGGGCRSALGRLRRFPPADFSPSGYRRAARARGFIPAMLAGIH